MLRVQHRSSGFQLVMALISIPRAIVRRRQRWVAVIWLCRQSAGHHRFRATIVSDSVICSGGMVLRAPRTVATATLYAAFLRLLRLDAVGKLCDQTYGWTDLLRWAPASGINILWNSYPFHDSNADFLCQITVSIYLYKTITKVRLGLRNVSQLSGLLECIFAGWMPSMLPKQYLQKNCMVK